MGQDEPARRGHQNLRWERREALLLGPRTQAVLERTLNLNPTGLRPPQKGRASSTLTSWKQRLRRKAARSEVRNARPRAEKPRAVLTIRTPRGVTQVTASRYKAPRNKEFPHYNTNPSPGPLRTEGPPRGGENIGTSGGTKLMKKAGTQLPQPQ